MAVAEMSKINLAAMSYDKDDILNALQRTGAAEIKLHSQTQYANPAEVDCDGLRAYLSEIESALGHLCRATENYYKQAKTKTDLLDEPEISYSEFMFAKDKKEWADGVVGQINAVLDNGRRLETELAKVRRDLNAALIYSGYKYPLEVANTAHSKIKLGTIPARQKDNFIKDIAEVPLASYSFEGEDNDSALILIATHKSDAQKTDDVLQLTGFTACPFAVQKTGEELYISLKEERERLESELSENNAEWANLSKGVRDLKIYCDYVAFELEKAQASEKMMFTASTFLLEAYVPKAAEEIVKGTLESLDKPMYFEFSKPAEDETPPTLLKNNKVVKNFEAVTNMYSPPNVRDFDPNTVMAFFYSIFLGFIMADMGYGIMMILGGSFLYLKTRRENMIKSLGGVFAIGGIFTVIWGFLFNSFFGFAILPFKVMPDLQGTEMSWSLAGINVPALLIISMLIGVVQLCAGYVCKAVLCWREGHILDGIFDGMVWAVFSVGVELAIVGFVEQFNLPILKLVGGITAGASLLVAILTAGRKEKLLGKFTKGFGSAYGVINYASDILSYARLYGLMLAGAVIADIITSNSVSLISSGNVFSIILGVAIMVIGHVFNLAIGLLGAYIHDARLQYVEFYGRFYEGEGYLFTPLGSTHKYISVNN
ncbi:MAG: V-type ATP synthase subunit I [Clostridia bacterium]|nr:V-type ATP synthase subunit I [Clostridia bacterium]